MAFEEFITKVDYVFNGFSYKNQLRYGQCVMNELYYVWPEKYKEITAIFLLRLETTMKTRGKSHEWKFKHSEHLA